MRTHEALYKQHRQQLSTYVQLLNIPQQQKDDIEYLIKHAILAARNDVIQEMSLAIAEAAKELEQHYATQLGV